MSNELTHYGVKGMKWGIRRKRDTVSKRQTRKSDSLIARKVGYSDRNIRIAKNRSSMEEKQLSQYYNDPKKGQTAKDLRAIGKKHFDAYIKTEEIYKKKLKDIDTTKVNYKGVKELIKNAEIDYRRSSIDAENEYFRERNKLSERYNRS